MTVEASVTMTGSKPAVWAAITNIANAAEIISGIEKIQVVEKPAKGLVGLRWRETRMLFGKPATVEKWITEAKENEYFMTRAEDGGFVFLTTNRISESGGGVTLTGTHETMPQGFVASLKALPMVFFKGVINKAILQDLNDIKAAVERAPWYAFDNGKSIGQKGSENGITIRDDEHGDGARITLERNGQTAPFLITCGIYGWMFHTRSFGKESEAQREFESMRLELTKIIGMIPLTSDPEVDSKSSNVTGSISEFVERFP